MVTAFRASRPRLLRGPAQALFARFDREQIPVYLYDDLQRDPAVLVRDIFAFLGVNTDFRPPTNVVFNKSGSPKSGFVHRFLMEPRP